MTHLNAWGSDEVRETSGSCVVPAKDPIDYLGRTLDARHYCTQKSIRAMISLQHIEACLNRRKRELQVLRGQVKPILQMSPSTPLRQPVYHTVTHRLRHRLPRLRD